MLSGTFNKHWLVSGTFNFYAHRPSQAVMADTENKEVARITFVFETICSVNCELYFMVVCFPFFAHCGASRTIGRAGSFIPTGALS